MAEKPFDPDAYLAKKPFDPDEYLRPKAVDTKSDPNSITGMLEAVRNYGDVLQRGALNTASFGLLNRGEAAVRALAGKAPSYSDALADIVKEQEEFRKENPKASIAADIFASLPGGIATGRAIARAVPQAVSTLPRLIGTGIVEGGVTGGLQGAGTTYSGIPSDYVGNAGMGAILGAGVGAAAPVVGATAGGIYRSIADRGWVGGVPRFLAEAAQADAPGLRNLPNIPGSMLPDAGPSMLGVAQGALPGTVGPGKSALTTNLRTRDVGTGRRIVGELDQTFGPARVPEHIEAEVRQQMQALGPAYDAALNNARAIDNRGLALWLEGEIGNTKGPAQAALRQVRGMLDIPTTPGVLDPHPRAMQATREAVRGMRDDPGIDPNVRRVLGIAHDRLTRELQAKVPGIRQLDSQYAELGAQERAVQPASQGRRLFQTEEPGVVRPMQLQEIMDEAARPKGANVGQSLEPTRLREAARAELDRIVGTNRNDLLKLESVLGQPQDWNAQKLAIMFGQDRADRLMDVLARERNFRNSFQKIVEGSQTDMRAAARAAQDANKGNFPLEATLWGTTLRGLQAGWRGLNARAAQMGRDRIAGMMAEQNPVRIQDLVDQMLAAQPTRDVRQEITRRLVDRGLMATVPAAARVAPKKRNER